MIRKIKMVVHHARLFVWLLKHTFFHKNSRAQFNSQLDHVEMPRAVTTIASCRSCGKQLIFTIPKASQK